jgi:hypothetical protein
MFRVYDQSPVDIFGQFVLQKTHSIQVAVGCFGSKRRNDSVYRGALKVFSHPHQLFFMPKF